MSHYDQSGQPGQPDQPDQLEQPESPARPSRRASRSSRSVRAAPEAPAEQADPVIVLPSRGQTETATGDSIQSVPRDRWLAVLLEDSDFWEGLQLGAQAFQDGLFREFHGRRWTQNDLIGFVEREVSGKLYRREVGLARLNGWPCHSYLYVLGFVLAYVNQAIAAKAQPGQPGQPESQAKE